MESYHKTIKLMLQITFARLKRFFIEFNPFTMATMVNCESFLQLSLSIMKHKIFLVNCAPQL